MAPAKHKERLESWIKTTIFDNIPCYVCLNTGGAVDNNQFPVKWQLYSMMHDKLKGLITDGVSWDISNQSILINAVFYMSETITHKSLFWPIFMYLYYLFHIVSHKNLYSWRIIAQGCSSIQELSYVSKQQASTGGQHFINVHVDEFYVYNGWGDREVDVILY